ncbi:MAG TPA: SGNH/GDSL hydrolase family protein [Sphingomicrobium sp.]|jgi:hypothetical protein
MAAALNLSVAPAGSGTYDLTALGTADWVVYPSVSLVRKASGGNLIAVAHIGTFTDSAATPSTNTAAWTDGTPTASGNTKNVVYSAAGAGIGYSLTFPAGVNQRTATILAGGYGTTIQVTAHLSDGSVADKVDSSTVWTSGVGLNRVITVTYAAASAGQTLTVSIVQAAGSTGNANIQGAALSTESATASTKPDAPTGATATAGTGTVSVSATPGANGGAAVSRYDVNVYAVDDNALLGTNYGTSFPIVVSGIPSELVYAKVTATNSVDTSNESAASNQVTPAAAPQPVQIANSNANIVWSPYNWDDYGTYKSANSCGAYAKLGFSGTSIAVKLDVSHMVAAGLPAAQYPIVRTIVDGISFVDTQLTSGTTTLSRTGLTDAAHTLEVVFLAAYTLTPDRWNTPVSAVRIAGFTLDSGKAALSIATRSKRLAYYGDSITEGYLSLGTTTTIPAGNSSLHTVVPSIAQALGAEYGQLGYGAQGYAQAGQGNVPNLNAAWNLYSAGRSRLVGGQLSPAPDYICVEHGANGATTQANVQTTITNLRAAAPSARIFMIVPAGGFARAAITAAVAANSGDAKLHSIDLGTEYEKGINNSGGNNMYALDALHRNVLSNARVASGYSAKMQAAIDGASAPALSARTVTVTMGDESGPVANLTGIEVSFFDEPTPGDHTVARFKTKTETTDANGTMTFSVMSTLPAGGSGSIDVLLPDGRNMFRTVTVS